MTDVKKLSKEQREAIFEMRLELMVVQDIEAKECKSILGGIVFNDACEKIDNMLDKAVDSGIISTDERENGIYR